MQSGCPHSQDGAYPAFQHRSNVGVLTSPQDNNVTTEPVVYPANGKQNIMVAIPYSAELRVAYSPPEWQRGSVPSPQNFPELHHQQESQASIENTGFQYPVSRDSACPPQNSHCQISRKVNDDFHSSAHVSAQHSSYFGASANKNSVRQSIYNSGQQKECSNRDFSRHSPEGSNLNKNNGLQQRNAAFSASTSSAVLQGGSLGVAAKTFPSQQCSSVSESKQQRYPLLTSLLKGNPPDFKSLYSNSYSSSEKTNSNIELNSSAHLSDERHCKSRHITSSLPALYCGQTNTLNPDQSGGTHPTLHQQQVSSSSLSGQPSTGQVLPVGETEIYTDDQIHNHISKKLSYYRTVLKEKETRYGHTLSNKGGSFCTNDRDSTLQSDRTMPKSNSVVVEQCTAAVGQEVEEDSSKGSKAKADLTPKFQEMGDCTTSASENHSTGTLLSAIENSKHAPISEYVEKSAPVACDLPVKKHLDVTMTAYGDGKLVYLDDCCEDKSFVSSNDESFHSKWRCDKSLQNVTTLQYTLTALKELIASLGNVEAIAEMDNFSEVILQQYWNGDIDNIHLFTSTEYPQIMGNIAATCTKNEDENPVVLTAVPGITLDELTERHPSLMVNCSSSQKEYKSVWLNINKNFDDIYKEPGVSGALKHMTAKERGFTGLKPVEAVGLYSVQGVTDVSEVLPPESGSVVSESKRFELTSPIENHDANTNKQKNTEDQQHCGVTCEEVFALSKANSFIQIDNVNLIPTYQSEPICEGVREEAGSVYSQMDLSIALSEKEVKEQAPLLESEGEEVLSLKCLKDPQYEDISDDDVSQLSTELPKTGHEELSFPTCFEDPQCDEISEDENSQIENPSLAQVPEPNNKQSLFENEGYRQGPAQMKTEIISVETLIPKKQVSLKTGILDAAQYCSSYFVEADDGFESERHLARQTNHTVSYSPSNVLKCEDQMDDDWIVIPISMSDLKFGPEDEDQDGPEEVLLDDGENGDNERQGGTTPMHCALHCPAPKPVPASASSHLEVFDTIESFRQAKSVKVGNCFEVATGTSTPEHEMDSEEEPHTPQQRREAYSEPEDSYETEDSCDYSSASEHNYLTVPRWLLKMSAPLPPEKYYSVSEKESDSDEVTNVQNSQTSSSDKLGHMQKLRLLIKAKAGSKHVQPKINQQRISIKEDIIIIDSDTEDEGDQNCNKKAKRKRLLSSGSVDSGDTLCSQQKRHSPETEDSPCGTVKERKNRPSSADLPAPQHQFKVNESQFKDVMEDACLDQSHSTKNGGQLIEANTGSEHVQHKISRQMISKKQSVRILSSDTEDESGHNYKKRKRKRLYLPRSANSGDTHCVQQKRPSLETVDTQCGTASEKLQEPRLSPADSSVPQHQTIVHDTQFRNVMEDACSDLSHRMRQSGQLIEPKHGFEHIQHKTIGQNTTSKKERTVFRGSEKVVKSDQICKKKAKEDSDNDLFATQNGLSTETVGRLSCEESPEKQPLSVDKKVDSSLVPNPGILRLVVQKSSPPNKCLKLLKESRVHKEDKDKTQVPKTPTATSKKGDSCDMNTPDLYRNKKVQCVSKPKPANERRHETKNEGQANVKKPKLVSRQLSLPSQEGPSISTGSLSSTSGQLSKARRSSDSSRGLSQSGGMSTSSAPPKSNLSPPMRRHSSSFKLPRSNSHSSPSTSNHPHTPPIYIYGTSSSANSQPGNESKPRMKQGYKNWHKSYIPTRKDRKTSLGMEEDLRTTNRDTQREARPGPSHCDMSTRQRHKWHPPPPALMKKSMDEAKQLTKHIHQKAPREPRSVGEGQRRSEQPLAAPKKVLSGRRSVDPLQDPISEKKVPVSIYLVCFSPKGTTCWWTYTTIPVVTNCL